MKNFRNTIPWLAIVLFSIAGNADAFNIYRVGDVIVGKEHNDVWKRWFDKDFSVWVGVSENTEYIVFKGETGLGDATVMLEYSKALRDKLEWIVSKAIEWSNVARKNKADTTKALGYFEWGLYKKNGLAYKENQIGFEFFAANGGQQTNLITKIVDRENRFVKASIYVDPPEMKKLLKNIQGIEAALKKARETASKQDLFK